MERIPLVNKAKYRNSLPQLTGMNFITDGGIETTLIFTEGQELRFFSAFHLLRTPDGRRKLTDYYRPYLDLAVDSSAGFILEAPTWRANRDWGDQLGYTREELAAANGDAIKLLFELRALYETTKTPCVISGCLGPRDDGYSPQKLMPAGEAEDYHSEQIGTFADAGVDMVTAITMTYPDEAIGIIRAAGKAGVPVAISFTTETDGRLPTGAKIGDAIAEVDKVTANAPVYYMINCAHPTHFETAITGGGAWAERIRGLRANASTKSHAELDEATSLDPGDTAELAAGYQRVARILPNLTILGGCCGTDHHHVKAILEARLGG